jgi:hypothetical protein
LAAPEKWFGALPTAGDEARWLAALADVPEAALDGLLRRHHLPPSELRSEGIEAIRQALTAGSLTLPDLDAWRDGVRDVMLAVDGLYEFRQKSDIAKEYRTRHGLPGGDLDAIASHIRNALWRGDIALADWVDFLDDRRHLLDRDLFLYQVSPAQLPDVQRWRDREVLAVLLEERGLGDLLDARRHVWRPAAPTLVRVWLDPAIDSLELTWVSWRHWVHDDGTTGEQRCVSFLRLSLATGEVELQMPYVDHGGMRALLAARDQHMRAAIELLGVAPAIIHLEPSIRALLEDGGMVLETWFVRDATGGLLRGAREERLFDRIKPGLERYYALELTGEWPAADDRTLTVRLDARTDAATIREQCEREATVPLVAVVRRHAAESGDPAAAPVRDPGDAADRDVVAKAIGYYRQLGRTQVEMERLTSLNAGHDLSVKGAELQRTIERVGVGHADATFVVLCPETQQPVKLDGCELHFDRPSEIPAEVDCDHKPGRPRRHATKGFVRLDVRRRPRPGSHTVVLIHGIRTQGEWQQRAAAALESDPSIRVVPMRYGFFDVVRFLVPIRSLRRRPIAYITKLMRDEIVRKPRRLSVVAHSFGTFIVSEILEQENEIELYRLILCGSIVRDDFPWEHLRDRLARGERAHWQVVNDCGMRDPWPVFAQSMTWGYGASGRFGFGHGRVKDRFHDVDHSGFFTEQFVRDYWLPYLTDGHIAAGRVHRPTNPWALSVLTVFRLRYVIVPAVVAGAAGLAFLLYGAFTR